MLARVHDRFVDDMSDRPFGCPPDIVLDIPIPPSVNSLRKVDWRAMGRYNAWKSQADMALLASGQYASQKGLAPIVRFELSVILDESCRCDADNVLKAAIDYLRRIDFILDDGPKNMRKITVEWGTAPAGCRLILRGAE